MRLSDLHSHGVFRFQRKLLSFSVLPSAIKLDCSKLVGSYTWDHVQGISKGVVVENLIATMLSRGKPPDFVLCIGDDRSDEDMFESIMSSMNNPSLPTIAEVFACTVGKKPSKAKYYLDDTVDVVKMLQGLANASSELPRPVQRQVSFEGSL